MEKAGIDRMKNKRSNRSVKTAVTVMGMLLLLVSSRAGPGVTGPAPNEADRGFAAEHRQALHRNPPDVTFTVRFKKARAQFYPGELISIELEFASRVPDLYELNGTTYNSIARLGLDTFHLDPSDGPADPLGDYFMAGG